MALRIVSLGVDTAPPTGKLMLNVLGGVAQFEREMMLERQREGIAKAKAEGAYKGRKPTARAKADKIKALSAEGLSMSAIAAKLGIGKGSVHRALSAGKSDSLKFDQGPTRKLSRMIQGGRMRAQLLICFLAPFVGFALSISASAQSTITYLDHPIPDVLRVHAEVMVRKLRPRDADEAIAKLRTSPMTESVSDLVVLRIEAGCWRNLCMTVLARNDESGMVPELILHAGAAMIANDFASDLWGSPAWFLHFEGKGGATLSVSRREEQWTVAVCAACLMWPTPKNPFPPENVQPPEPPKPPLSFEEFRAFVGR